MVSGWIRLFKTARRRDQHGTICGAVADRGIADLWIRDQADFVLIRQIDGALRACSCIGRINELRHDTSSASCTEASRKPMRMKSCNSRRCVELQRPIIIDVFVQHNLKLGGDHA